MRKERTINIIILAVCIILYIFIRIFRTIYSGNAFAFLRYHFTDLLAPIVVLSYSGLLLNIVNHHSINKFLQIIVRDIGNILDLKYSDYLTALDTVGITNTTDILATGVKIV